MTTEAHAEPGPEAGAMVPAAPAPIVAFPSPGPALAPAPGPAPMFTPKQIEVLRRMFFADCDDDEVVVALAVCHRTQLDPFARQIYFVKRRDKKKGRETLAPQVSIDGFRLIAQRSGKYRGQVGPYWLDGEGRWHEAWPYDTAPVAARVGVLHADFDQPCYGVARFNAYAGRWPDGGLMDFWKRMPDLMIAKVAEALALRKAFPMELSGLYTDDEMDQAERDDGGERRERRTAAAREQAPARGADAPTPAMQAPHLVAQVKQLTGEVLGEPAQLVPFLKEHFPTCRGFKYMDDAALNQLILKLRRARDARKPAAAPARDAAGTPAAPAAAPRDEADYWAEQDAAAEAALAAAGAPSMSAADLTAAVAACERGLEGLLDPNDPANAALLNDEEIPF